jgi:hypothetical protein
MTYSFEGWLHPAGVVLFGHHRPGAATAHGTRESAADPGTSTLVILLRKVYTV